MEKNFYPIDFCENGRYLIRFSEKVYKFFGKTESSYNVIPSRILGLSYPSFLRFVRDKFNAEIDNQSLKYPVAQFNSEKDCQEVCDILNERFLKIENLML